MRIAFEHDVHQVLEGFVAPSPGECAAQGMTTQGVEDFNVHKVRNVETLAGSLDLLPNAPGSRAGSHERVDDGRGVQDDQGPLPEISGVVRVPETTNRDLRRLVQLDRFAFA